MGHLHCKAVYPNKSQYSKPFKIITSVNPLIRLEINLDIQKCYHLKSKCERLANL